MLGILKRIPQTMEYYTDITVIVPLHYNTALD